MRLWISPELEKIEINDGISHSMTVVDDPLRYGLDPIAVADYMRLVNDGDADVQFDFDAVITLAEMAGWVRISGYDFSDGREIALSTSDARPARRVLRAMREDGLSFEGGVALEFERILNGRIIMEHRSLDTAGVDLFIQSGRLPLAHRGSISLEPETSELIKAVLEARRPAAASHSPAQP
jgi:hypothetical protein